MAATEKSGGGRTTRQSTVPGNEAAGTKVKDGSGWVFRERERERRERLRDSKGLREIEKEWWETRVLESVN